MQADTYDSDDACNRSPPLEPQKINYALDESLPPFVRKRSPSPKGGGQNEPDRGSPSGPSRKNERKPPPQSSLADAVLISHLAPNRPDIVNAFREQPLEAEWPDDEDMQSKTAKETRTEPTANPQPATLAAEALSLLPELQKTYDENSPMKTDGSPPTLIPSDKKKTHRVPERIDFHIKTEPLSPRPFESKHRPSITSEHNPTNDTLKTTPLGKYAIPASSRSAQELLPALQSPPQSIFANSPENPQSLPSLQSALGEQLLEAAPKDHSSRINNGLPHHLPPIPASSPTLNRSAMGHERTLSGPLPPPQMPSPYSHVSPGSTKEISAMSPPSSQPPYWRTTSTVKPELPYMTSPYEPSPHIPQAVNSPATSYPTPTEPKTVNEPERSIYPSAPSQSNGPVPAGSFKCSYPGCTAPPFQTQYLLNSHANVHSQERPHYCPLPGCPRGVGGKGFKRKNEMIRHGLVHNSPGYECPFCKEQQHLYPRPDNLQRHVKVHHKDKSKDDPELRRVLAQRPEGGPRGRRRRAHS
ncbi:hypothetical protein DTO271D3_1490 [Paecilomyces variotii]|nr:hypothetical protein DTO212C5_3686 [Paecilomyces variotii]KAJ9307326.1 hypothetical protein DTO217A2_3205 [Paecilomyces variotii]KAJ9318233.1 hypothetical protein DTO271D3_1490 [Paecilomyces variotii]